jgi:hypothetical protein
LPDALGGSVWVEVIEFGDQRQVFVGGEGLVERGTLRHIP